VRILVVGAGSTGAFFAARLARRAVPTRCWRARGGAASQRGVTSVNDHGDMVRLVPMAILVIGEQDALIAKHAT
jgi:glycine/D-amino acid oxidase-like deaminating enzyme